MPKTVVGLFKNAGLADAAVPEIEAPVFPRRKVRTMREPTSFDVTGVMSFPRLDFEVDLNRELARIRGNIPGAPAYVEGLRRGAALAFATGPDEKVEADGKTLHPGCVGLARARRQDEVRWPTSGRPGSRREMAADFRFGRI